MIEHGRSIPDDRGWWKFNHTHTTKETPMTVRIPGRIALAAVLFALVTSLAGCAGDSPTEIQTNDSGRCYWDGGEYVCI